MTSTRIKGCYRRRLTMTLWLVAAASGAWAQYNITPLAVSPVYLKSQLWAISISNTVGPFEARIQMDMKDMTTRQSVLTAATGIFLVPKGATILSINSLQPIIYNYNSPAVVDRTPNGPLPVGQYQVCYQLILATGETQPILAEDCDEVAVEPMSPPLLTSPEDDSVVTVPQPNFTWTPPAPLSMFSDLSYDVIVTEVSKGQSVTDAIQRNLPLQQAEGLRQPFMTYPLTGPQLDTNTTYAWQVVARNQQTFAAKSEVWTFRTSSRPLGKRTGNSTYIVMGGRMTGVGTSDAAALHLKYVSYAATYSTTVTIWDDKGKIVLTAPVLVRQGDNYLDIPLDDRLSLGQRYTADLSDPAGQTISVTFVVK